MSRDGAKKRSPDSKPDNRGYTHILVSRDRAYKRSTGSKQDRQGSAGKEQKKQTTLTG